MRRLLLILGLFFWCATAHASFPTVLQESGLGLCASAGATSLPCALPNNLTAGTTLLADTYTDSGTTTTPTGCGVTWIPLPLNNNFAGPGQSSLYFAQNAGTGSCTATFTTSVSGRMQMKLVEVNGEVSAYPFEFWAPWQYLSTSSIEVDFQTNCTTCLAITFGNVGCDPGTFSGSSGWTQMNSSGGSLTNGIIAFRKNVSSSGAFSNVMTGTCAIGGSGVIFQSALRTVGRIQQNVCVNFTGGTVNCAFLFPPTAGDAYLVTPSCSASGFSYTFSNNASLTPRILPGFSFYVDTWFFQNVPSTVPTFTAAFSGGGGNCTSNANMFITEVRGLAHTGAYANGAQNFDLTNTFTGGSTTSWNSTPVTIYQPGTYYLYSPVANIFGQLITPTGAGWSMGLEDRPGQPTLTAMFDQTISIATPTAIDSAVTFPSAESEPDIGLWAFGAAAYTLPQVIQTITTAGITVAWLNPVQSGSDLVFNAQSQSNVTGAWAFSQDCGGTTANVYTAGSVQIGCQTGDQFCPFVANNVTGGTCHFTVTKNSGAAFVTAAEVTGVTAIQGGNFGTSSGSFPVATGNVTTTNPTSELIAFCTAGWAESSSTVALGTDATFTQSQQGAIDQAGNSMVSKTVLAPGTYSDSCTGVGSESSFRSALIVPFTLTPIIINTQPHVTIALNGAAIRAHEIGAQ